MAAISGTRPWDTAVHTPSGTTFESLDFPSWVRRVTLVNQGTGTMYVGKGATGAPDPAVTPGLPPNGSVGVNLTPGRQRAPQVADRSIAVALTDGASGSVGLYLFEAP